MKKKKVSNIILYERVINKMLEFFGNKIRYTYLIISEKNGIDRIKLIELDNNCRMLKLVNQEYKFIQ